ncbi:mechanosensitive ion channel family protein [Neolewinella aurantiaca]|uniref:Mechanosensitive ion channel family protein n=1 Tax=Neolewinella aurantiaca TaxID=2602767 RepID=A0A5C7FIB8_9BACT|nr:mechanosensitive ion channel family protein [Neolewinella aurantiaca]TXF85226.1 mechanosensitive ion channel family protein [Neolewinella aurantiaca]
METLLDYISDTPVYAQLLIAFGFALLIATVMVMIIFPILRASAKKTKSFTLEAFAKRTRTAVFWLIAMLLTFWFWTAISSGIAEAELPFYLPGALHLPRTLLYFFTGVFLIKVVQVVGDTIRYRYNMDDVNNLRERKILTQLQYIQRIASIIIFVVVVSFILLQFEGMRSLGTGLLSTAGVGGIIIGLAAQKSIANLLAGFQIAFTQPIRLDDVLIVEGEYGTVEEITLTYVTLKLWDQRRLIVPLNYFIDHYFQNWTRFNSELTGSVFLHLDYTFPVDKLRAEVNRYLPTQELWDERVNSVAVTDTTDRVIVVRILVSSNNAGNTFTLRCNTREHMLQWIRENYPDSLPTTRTDKGQILTPGVIEELDEN